MWHRILWRPDNSWWLFSKLYSLCWCKLYLKILYSKKELLKIRALAFPVEVMLHMILIIKTVYVQVIWELSKLIQMEPFYHRKNVKPVIVIHSKDLMIGLYMSVRVVRMKVRYIHKVLLHGNVNALVICILNLWEHAY